MLLDFLNKLASIRFPLRPPGAVTEDGFLKKCIRCRKCEEACPYLSIQMAHDKWGLKMGTSFIYPEKVPCYLCEDFPCIDVCPTNALEPVDRKENVTMGLAVIDKDLCFAFNGIICRSCYERCPIYTIAITLKDELYPEVKKEHCVGCGICVHVCPTEPRAITMISAHKS